MFHRLWREDSLCDPLLLRHDLLPQLGSFLLHLVDFGHRSFILLLPVTCAKLTSEGAPRSVRVACQCPVSKDGPNFTSISLRDSSIPKVLWAAPWWSAMRPLLARPPLPFLLALPLTLGLLLLHSAHQLTQLLIGRLKGDHTQSFTICNLTSCAVVVPHVLQAGFRRVLKAEWGTGTPHLTPAVHIAELVELAVLLGQGSEMAPPTQRQYLLFDILPAALGCEAHTKVKPIYLLRDSQNRLLDSFDR
ncbi:hypothetical protein JZ751_008096 [Albula glossodonta]|uniref:Uncharacterized protein n=1 Tax=Albula glossodonta TaxID=121402 RepID=A0A8T2P4R9_9TELE|nr:hypothetical protein JZ751_008096 [Albula glossodonta]